MLFLKRNFSTVFCDEESTIAIYLKKGYNNLYSNLIVF